jgi:hypothetical protein
MPLLQIGLPVSIFDTERWIVLFGWHYRNNPPGCLQVGGTGLRYNQWAGITIFLVCSLNFVLKNCFGGIKVIRSIHVNKLTARKTLSDYSSWLFRAIQNCICHNLKKYSLNKHLIPATLNSGRQPEKNGNWKVLLTPKKMTLKVALKLS